MKVSEYYKTESAWLKAADLGGKKVALTIDSVEEVTFKGDERPKLAIKFRGKDKGMVLNKTNAQVIISMHGDDTDSWVGKEIKIFPTTTTFGEDVVDCIRVEQHVEEAFDDDVPF